MEGEISVAGNRTQTGLGSYDAARRRDQVSAHAWTVGRASELLMNPAITITDIAFSLGFPSSQHFATMFRKHMGATPSDWRRARML